jgi:hypothetical protein
VIGTSPLSRRQTTPRVSDHRLIGTFAFRRFGDCLTSLNVRSPDISRRDTQPTDP